MRYMIPIVGLLLASPVVAQTVATLPVTCNASASSCVQATPVVNPDGSLIGAGGGGSATTRTTAAGTSDTQAIPVQGVTGGVPQNVTGSGTAGTPAAGVVSVQGVTNGVAQNVTSRGSASVATGQVSVGTTATLIRAADTTRTSISVIVPTATSCAFGGAGVTLTTGYLLPAVAGATDTSATSAAWYGVCSAATTVSFKALF